MSNSGSTFSPIERANHWIIAVAFLSLLTAGWILSLDTLAEPVQRQVRDMHKAFGVLVLLFGLWRVGYRLARGFPQPVPGIGPVQATAAKAVHYLLLVAVILMPLSGIAKSWYAGRPISLFGLVAFGSPANKDPSLGPLFSNVHYLAGLTISAVLVVHILAALKHHWIDRDDTLRRMVRG